MLQFMSKDKKLRPLIFQYEEFFEEMRQSKMTGTQMVEDLKNVLNVNPEEDFNIAAAPADE